jgi:hypothetical protein
MFAILGFMIFSLIWSIPEALREEPNPHKLHQFLVLSLFCRYCLGGGSFRYQVRDDCSNIVRGKFIRNI